MVIEVSPERMLSIGLHFVGYDLARTQNVSVERNEERFVYMYGASSNVCSIIFDEIQMIDIGNSTINKPTPKHFLMCLYWLKKYQT
jgi:hypothetical protein